MASPCVEDGCGIRLLVTDDVLSGEAIIAPLPCNGITCVPGFGLFAYEDESDVIAGTVPIGGAGWSVDLGFLPVGVPIEVTSDPYTITPGVGPMPTTTLTNASACLAQNLISVITGREVRYDGPTGAWFSVQTQADINGGGFLDAFNITSDYQFFSFAAAHSDARASGAAANGIVIAPAGFYTFRYRQILTNLAAIGPGAIVTSPGLTFCNLTVTN